MSTYQNSKSRRSLKRKPAIEGMERRDLMSVAGLFVNYGREMSHVNAAFSAAQSRAGRAAATPTPGQPIFSSKGTPLSSSINYALAQFATNNNLVPTPHEVARQTLISKFQGQYVVGPPRFISQSFQITIKGAGGSTQSFHESLLMAVYMPKTPGNQITGIATLIPKNVAETGSELVLDLVADPNSVSHGLPTHFTWTADSNSGGVYLAGGGQGVGYGTLDVHFTPGGHLRQRASGGGKVNVVVQGLINAGGVFSDIQVPGAH